MVEQADASRPSQEENLSPAGVLLQEAANRYKVQMNRAYYDIANDPHAPLGEQVYRLGEEKEHIFHGIVNWGMGSRQSDSDQTIMITESAAVVRWGGTMDHERPVNGQEGIVSDKRIKNPVNERVMTKGDVVEIPKDTPYQISPKGASDTVSYLALRAPSQE